MDKVELKVGLALLTAEWFTQINYDTTGDASANISAVIQHNAKCAADTLRRHFSIVHPEIITTVADAQAACDEYRRENVDAIVLCNLIYSGDDTIIEIAQQMRGLPVLLWSFNICKRLPRITSMGQYFSVTGAAGMLQGCAPLKRMGVKFDFVLGVPGDARLDRELHDWTVAQTTAKRMRSLHIASIGRRYEPMSGAWIDELKLKTRLGPKMTWISAYEYAKACEAVDERELAAFVAEQKALYPAEGVTDEDIRAGARAAMGCYALCKKYGCEVLSVQDMDDEIHELVGCRPQMSYQKMFDEGMIAGMEADIDSALCTWILRSVSEGPAMYGEIFTYDEEENYLVIGHASMHDLRLAGNNPIKLVPDMEFMFSDRYKGVWDEFVCKDGPVTLCAMFEDNDHYRWVVFSGNALKRPGVVPGNVHALVHTDIPLPDFMKAITTIGVTQHFALCYGDVKGRLELLAKRLGIEFVDLDRMMR